MASGGAWLSSFALVSLAWRRRYVSGERGTVLSPMVDEGQVMLAEAAVRCLEYAIADNPAQVLNAFARIIDVYVGSAGLRRPEGLSARDGIDADLDGALWCALSLISRYMPEVMAAAEHRVSA